MQPASPGPPHCLPNYCFPFQGRGGIQGSSSEPQAVAHPLPRRVALWPCPAPVAGVVTAGCLPGRARAASTPREELAPHASEANLGFERIFPLLFFLLLGLEPWATCVLAATTPLAQWFSGWTAEDGLGRTEGGWGGLRQGRGPCLSVWDHGRQRPCHGPGVASAWFLHLRHRVPEEAAPEDPVDVSMCWLLLGPVPGQ